MVAPLNAPPAAAARVGVQPGTSRTIVIANAVIVFGSSGAPVGVFVYGIGTIPGAGNPPVLAMTNQTTDPFGNTVAPLGGITAGQYPNVQLSLQAVGGAGELAFLLNSASFANGRLETGLFGAFSQVVLVSPASTATGFVDQVAAILNSSDGTASFANLALAWFDNSGTEHAYFVEDGTGVTIAAAKSIIATEPGTGTSHVNFAAGETWHTATLLNSWAASGSGVNGVFYRMLPWGDGMLEVIGDIINTTATGNSICATLPAGWRPSINSNHPCAVNNGGAARAMPWVFVDTSGDVQITGIVTANLETMFHVFVPMDLTK